MYRSLKQIGVIVASLGITTLSFVACGPEASEPEPERLGAAEQPDKVTDCSQTCTQFGVGSDKRFSCCSHCILGIDYGKPTDPQGVGWVCSTETQEFLKCSGQNSSGVKNRCSQNTGCGPGFHEVPNGGDFKAGTYCYGTGHVINFACFDCDGNGDCQSANDDFNAKPPSAHDCPNAKALCNSSGGSGDQSHYSNCDNYGDMPTCCAPDQLIPPTPTTTASASAAPAAGPANAATAQTGLALADASVADADTCTGASCDCGCEQPAVVATATATALPPAPAP